MSLAAVTWRAHALAADLGLRLAARRLGVETLHTALDEVRELGQAFARVARVARAPSAEEGPEASAEELCRHLSSFVNSPNICPPARAPYSPRSKGVENI